MWFGYFSKENSRQLKTLPTFLGLKLPQRTKPVIFNRRGHLKTSTPGYFLHLSLFIQKKPMFRRKAGLLQVNFSSHQN
jgi:hypothetical protein